MKTKNNNTIQTIIFIYMMVFCVVFSSPLKIFIDTIDKNMKESSELLEEEEKDIKEEHKNEKELFSLTDLKSKKILLKNRHSAVKIIHKCQVNYIRPYFKVHTPPPDFLFLV